MKYETWNKIQQRTKPFENQPKILKIISCTPEGAKVSYIKDKKSETNN